MQSSNFREASRSKQAITPGQAKPAAAQAYHSSKACRGFGFGGLVLGGQAFEGLKFRALGVLGFRVGDLGFWAHSEF